MRLRASLGAIVAVLASTAGAARAVVGGSPDATHVYVGAAELPDGSGGFELCSGSLVSSTVFVTAAHCFPDGSTVEVTFTEDATAAGATFTAGTVHVDPTFCLGCANGLPGADTGDIAVVTLDAPVPQPRYAQLPTLALADTLKTRQVDVVGYGVQGFSGKAATAVGTRESATTTVKGSGALSAEFLKLLDSPGACFGDSGGPDLVHGTDTMVALTSFTGGNPHCNGVSYSERLDTAAALAFVESFLS